MRNKLYAKCLDVLKELRKAIKGCVFVTIKNNVIKIIIKEEKQKMYTREINDLLFFNDIRYITNAIIRSYRDYMDNMMLYKIMRGFGV